MLLILLFKTFNMLSNIVCLGTPISFEECLKHTNLKITYLH